MSFRARPVSVMMSNWKEERSHGAQDQHHQLGLGEPALSLVTGGWAVAVTSAAGDLGQNVDRGDVEERPGGEEHGETRGGDGVGAPGPGAGQQQQEGGDGGAGGGQGEHQEVLPHPGPVQALVQEVGHQPETSWSLNIIKIIKLFF